MFIKSMAETDQVVDARGSSGWLILFVSVVPLLYVLSIGPVAAVVSRTKNNQSMRLLERIYAPVIWLHDHTFLKEPLEAYVALWGVK